MRTRPIALIAAALFGLAGCGAGTSGPDASATSEVADASLSPSAPPASAVPPAATPTPAPRAVATPAFPTGVEPARIVIPAIGVDATFTEPLGMLSPTEMEVPADPDLAGWFALSRRPGEIGPAIVAGHVDSATGPAVFHRLRELAPGDEITVHGTDGDRRTFVVERRGQFPKDALPDDVFGYGEPRPELRLITCGGTFDRSTGHYRDNVVVYTRLADA